jgi:hypothetical protein
MPLTDSGWRENPVSVDALKRLAALALTAVLLTACGGGAVVDGAKVEDSLRHYLRTPYPQACLNGAFCPQSNFPLGAGVPRVRENSCKKAHTGRIRPARTGRIRPALPEGLTFWSCVVTFGRTAFPVAVLVKRSGEVYLATLMSQAAPPRPATVYEGGP